MPRSAKTGTEKKATKLAFKSGRKREKVALDAYKQGIEGTKRTARGEGLLPESLEEITKRMAPQHNEALRQFDQLSAPDVRSQFGASQGQGSKSSAMTQALSAARGNLESQIQSNLSGQMQQNQLMNLQARMQADASLAGQQMNPLNAWAAQQANYLPSSGQPGVGKQLLGHGIDAAAGAVGTFFGGPGGGMAAYQLSNQATQKLKGTNKANTGVQEAGQWGGNKMLDFLKPQAGA
jgi:hypothetical protein